MSSGEGEGAATARPLRILALDQYTERVLLDVSVWARDRPIDIQVTYPDGRTIRYSREID